MVWMRAMLKPRNEILESGQEVVLYHDTAWVGDIRCTGVLVKKLIGHSSWEEEWEVIPDDSCCSETWWLGSILPIQKDNNVATKE